MVKSLAFHINLLASLLKWSTDIGKTTYIPGNRFRDHSLEHRGWWHVIAHAVRPKLFSALKQAGVFKGAFWEQILSGKAPGNTSHSYVCHTATQTLVPALTLVRLRLQDRL